MRSGRIRRFLVRTSEDGERDEVTVVLARVSSSEIDAYLLKVQAMPGGTKAEVAARESNRND